MQEQAINNLELGMQGFKGMDPFVCNELSNIKVEISQVK